MITFYLIVRCNQCGTPQYIRETQKTRTCPKCGKRIKCKILKVLAKADSPHEALRIVQKMKRPSKFEAPIDLLHSKLQGSIKQKEEILGNLISELIKIFPNQLPHDYLIQQATKFDLTQEFIDDTLTKLNDQGLVIINRNHQLEDNRKLLKFPSLPFRYGKMVVSRSKKKDK